MNAIYHKLLSVLSLYSEEREARAEAFYILEEAFGITRTDVYADKVRNLSGEEQRLFNEIVERVGQGMPVQYAVGHSWFKGRKFSVNPDVLIPRPETEELVDMVAAWCKNKSYTILDAGTGSGCIAISLKLALPQCTVTACDISEKALATASENTERLGADVILEKQDILRFPSDKTFDIIVSNPPYVCESEKSSMQRQVIGYEPHTALFVSDKDPLIFYKSLAVMGKTAKGVFCELNAALALQTQILFEAEGYKHVVIEKDAFGKNRFLKTEFH